MPLVDSIHVAVRVRPLSSHELSASDACVVGTTRNAIELTDPVSLELSASYSTTLPGFRLPRRSFSFDRVYTSASQAALYSDLGRSTLDHAFDGYNACVFSYGQSGSGKSYTMLGSSGVLDPSSSDMGLIPRLCHDLFQRMDSVRLVQRRLGSGGGGEGGPAAAALTLGGASPRPSGVSLGLEPMGLTPLRAARPWGPGRMLEEEGQASSTETPGDHKSSRGVAEPSRASDAGVGLGELDAGALNDLADAELRLSPTHPLAARPAHGVFCRGGPLALSHSPRSYLYTRTEFTVTCSFLEIYCEAVYDLLALHRLGGGGEGSASQHIHRHQQLSHPQDSHGTAAETRLGGALKNRLSPPSAERGSKASSSAAALRGHSKATGGRGGDFPAASAAASFDGTSTGAAAARGAAAASSTAFTSSSGSPSSPGGGYGSGLRVREHPQWGTYVEGLAEVPVSCYAEVEALLVVGTAVRSVAGTRQNRASSRSHALFTLKLTQRVVDNATGTPVNERVSKITLVDLAGSERTDSVAHSPTPDPPAVSAPASHSGGPSRALLPTQGGAHNISSNGAVAGKGAGTKGKPSPPQGRDTRVPPPPPQQQQQQLSPAAAAQRRAREMSKINTSLSALGAVIKALSSHPTNRPSGGASAPQSTLRSSAGAPAAAAGGRQPPLQGAGAPTAAAPTPAPRSRQLPRPLVTSAHTSHPRLLRTAADEIGAILAGEASTPGMVTTGDASPGDAAESSLVGSFDPDNGVLTTASPLDSLRGKAAGGTGRVGTGGSPSANGPFVPYRNSVLTWLLRDCLGGNSRTTMIATISPSEACYAETLSTLKYAESVKRVTQRATVNDGLRHDDAARVIETLREEVARLRGQLLSLLEARSAAPLLQDLSASGRLADLFPAHAGAVGVLRDHGVAFPPSSAVLTGGRASSAELGFGPPGRPAAGTASRHVRFSDDGYDGVPVDGAEGAPAPPSAAPHHSRPSSSSSSSSGMLLQQLLRQSGALGQRSHLTPTLFSPDSLVDSGPRGHARDGACSSMWGHGAGDTGSGGANGRTPAGSGISSGAKTGPFPHARTLPRGSGPLDIDSGSPVAPLEVGGLLLLGDESEESPQGGTAAALSFQCGEGVAAVEEGGHCPSAEPMGAALGVTLDCAAADGPPFVLGQMFDAMPAGEAAATPGDALDPEGEDPELRAGDRGFRLPPQVEFRITPSPSRKRPNRAQQPRGAGWTIAAAGGTAAVGASPRRGAVDAASAPSPASIPPVTAAAGFVAIGGNAVARQGSPPHDAVSDASDPPRSGRPAGVPPPAAAAVVALPGTAAPEAGDIVSTVQKALRGAGIYVTLQPQPPLPAHIPLGGALPSAPSQPHSSSTLWPGPASSTAALRAPTPHAVLLPAPSLLDTEGALSSPHELALALEHRERLLAHLLLGLSPGQGTQAHRGGLGHTVSTSGMRQGTQAFPFHFAPTGATSGDGEAAAAYHASQSAHSNGPMTHAQPQSLAPPTAPAAPPLSFSFASPPPRSRLARPGPAGGASYIADEFSAGGGASRPTGPVLIHSPTGPAVAPSSDIPASGGEHQQSREMAVPPLPAAHTHALSPEATVPAPAPSPSHGALHPAAAEEAATAQSPVDDRSSLPVTGSSVSDGCTDAAQPPHSASLHGGSPNELPPAAAPATAAIAVVVAPAAAVPAPLAGASAPASSAPAVAACAPSAPQPPLSANNAAARGLSDNNRSGAVKRGTAGGSLAMPAAAYLGDTAPAPARVTSTAAAAVPLPAPQALALIATPPAPRVEYSAVLLAPVHLTLELMPPIPALPPFSMTSSDCLTLPPCPLRYDPVHRTLLHAPPSLNGSDGAGYGRVFEAVVLDRGAGNAVGALPAAGSSAVGAHAEVIGHSSTARTDGNHSAAVVCSIPTTHATAGGSVAGPVPHGPRSSLPPLRSSSDATPPAPAATVPGKNVPLSGGVSTVPSQGPAPLDSQDPDPLVRRLRKELDDSHAALRLMGARLRAATASSTHAPQVPSGPAAAHTHPPLQQQQRDDAADAASHGASAPIASSTALASVPNAAASELPLPSAPSQRAPAAAALPGSAIAAHSGTAAASRHVVDAENHADGGCSECRSRRNSTAASTPVVASAAATAPGDADLAGGVHVSTDAEAAPPAPGALSGHSTEGLLALESHAAYVSLQQPPPAASASNSGASPTAASPSPAPSAAAAPDDPQHSLLPLLQQLSTGLQQGLAAARAVQDAAMHARAGFASARASLAAGSSHGYVRMHSRRGSVAAGETVLPSLPFPFGIALQPAAPAALVAAPTGLAASLHAPPSFSGAAPPPRFASDLPAPSPLSPLPVASGPRAVAEATRGWNSRLAAMYAIRGLAAAAPPAPHPAAVYTTAPQAYATSSLRPYSFAAQSHTVAGGALSQPAAVPQRGDYTLPTDVEIFSPRHPVYPVTTTVASALVAPAALGVGGGIADARPGHSTQVTAAAAAAPLPSPGAAGPQGASSSPDEAASEDEDAARERRLRRMGINTRKLRLLRPRSASSPRSSSISSGVAATEPFVAGPATDVAAAPFVVGAMIPADDRTGGVHVGSSARPGPESSATPRPARSTSAAPNRRRRVSFAAQLVQGGITDSLALMAQQLDALIASPGARVLMAGERRAAATSS